MYGVLWRQKKHCNGPLTTDHAVLGIDGAPLFEQVSPGTLASLEALEAPASLDLQEQQASLALLASLGPQVGV